MSVLQARESIMRINESIYAQGGMSAEDGRSYFQELKREAMGPKHEKELVAPRPTTMAELAHMAPSSVNLAGG